MAIQELKNSTKQEILEELISQAWMLSDDQISVLQPGSESLNSLVQHNRITSHPFSYIDSTSLEDPVKHFLNLMRQPEFFPFTCKSLLSMTEGEPLTILPFQQIILTELWNRQFPMLIATRGGGKSAIIGIFILLKLLFHQGSKIVVTGSGFRQARIVFEYAERLWYKSPVYRDMVGGQFSRVPTKDDTGRGNGPRRGVDRFEFVIGDSVATFIPIGDGGAIRGLRSNCTISDEFQSLNPDIYEQVIQGFGSVSLDPVQNVKDAAREAILKQLGMWNADMDEEERKTRRGNQAIIAGTADYAFNHFYRYYNNYRRIIKSKGDNEALEQIFNGPAEEGFDWRDFSVMRLPYKLLPKGFMEQKTIARAKQLNNSLIFAMEYDTVFPQDSDGFFRRSLIEKCVVGKKNQKFEFISDPDPDFSAQITGKRGKKHIMAVDPASENDKFSVVILELWPDHRRVVYCWTTKKSTFKEKLKRGVTEEHNFYAYCARKIRDLHKSFVCDTIMIDAGSGGGGGAILEALRDKDKIKLGETLIFEKVDPDPKNEKDSDNMDGEHIIEMVNFRDNSWVSEANHGMKKDFEDRIILFPRIDGIAMAQAMGEDEAEGRIVKDDDGDIVQIYDTLEDVVFEIEALKDELATIIVTKTPSGLEKWDVPQSKDTGAAKTSGRLRKDRYSALLMANMAARQLFLAYQPTDQREEVGGFAHHQRTPPNKVYEPKELYVMPLRLKNKVKTAGYGTVVRRGV